MCPACRGMYQILDPVWIYEEQTYTTLVLQGRYMLICLVVSRVRQHPQGVLYRRRSHGIRTIDPCRPVRSQ